MCVFVCLFVRACVCVCVGVAVFPGVVRQHPEACQQRGSADEWSAAAFRRPAHTGQEISKDRKEAELGRGRG